jgi:hypothetical protein
MVQIRSDEYVEVPMSEPYIVIRQEGSNTSVRQRIYQSLSYESFGCYAGNIW